MHRVWRVRVRGGAMTAELPPSQLLVYPPHSAHERIAVQRALTVRIAFFPKKKKKDKPLCQSHVRMRPHKPHQAQKPNQTPPKKRRKKLTKSLSTSLSPTPTSSTPSSRPSPPTSHYHPPPSHHHHPELPPHLPSLVRTQQPPLQGS